MALWSLVTHLDEPSIGFATQVQADSAQAALRKLLGGKSLRRFLERNAGAEWPKAFRAKDVVMNTPMTGLVNTHLFQVGRQGKYLTITVVKTALL